MPHVTSTNSPHPTDSQLRSEGLPWLVPTRRWHHNLLWRTVPPLVWMLVAFLIVELNSFSHEEAALSATAAVGLLAILFIVPSLCSAAAAAGLNRVSSPVIKTTALLVLLTCYAFILYSDMTFTSPLAFLRQYGGFLLLVLAMTWSGVFSIFAWVGEAILKQTGALLSSSGHSLAIIVMLVMFGFYSSETWQAASHLTEGRLAAFSTLLLVLALASTVPEALSRMKQANVFSDSLRDSWLGKLNIVVIITATQIIQALLFFLLFFAILVVFAWLTVPPEVQEIWVKQPTENLRINSTTFSVSVASLVTAGFISSIAMLAFLVQSMSNTELRAKLFDPLIQSLTLATSAEAVAASTEIPDKGADQS